MSELSVSPTLSPYSTGFDATGHTLEDLFPEIDPEFRPFGARVLVQLRRVFSQTKGGIILVQDSKDTEAWNIQSAKLIAVGPLAFKNRATADAWPEGAWAQLGDFVLVPRYGGDRRSIKAPDGKEDVVIVLLDDKDLYGALTGDPLKVKAYIS